MAPLLGEADGTLQREYLRSDFNSTHMCKAALHGVDMLRDTGAAGREYGAEA